MAATRNNTSNSSNTMQVQATGSIQGDTLERLCWRVYGRLMLASNLVEQVLALNHGLADFGAVLPVGTPVVLPVVKAAATTQETVQLWD